MAKKTGNLIVFLKEGDDVVVDGPARILIKEIKKNKVVVMIDGDDDTKILRQSKKKEQIVD